MHFMGDHHAWVLILRLKIAPGYQHVQVDKNIISVFTHYFVQSSWQLGQLGILVKGGILLQKLWVRPTALWQDKILFKPKVILRKTLIYILHIQPFQTQTSVPREVLPWKSSWRGQKTLQYTPLSRYILDFEIFYVLVKSGWYEWEWNKTERIG